LSQTKNLPVKQVEQLTVDLTKFGEAAAELQAQADRAEIKTAEDYAKGGDLIKIARTQSSKVEDLRTTLVGPFNKLVKFINAECKKPKEAFKDVRSTIEKKMLVWKAEEDKRLKAEAEEERKRLEAEALARAEQEKTAEAQDEVLDAAADAGEEIVEKAGVGLARGNFGSSTGTKKKYTTNVINVSGFLGSLVQLADNGEVELGSIVEFKKGGMNKLAEYMLTKRTAGKGKTPKIPGAEFIESEDIRVY
jgi:hypothetical protein